MSLVITKGGGFFSCCSVRLHYIIKYFNLNKKLPENVDSSNQFKLYKKNNNEDIIFEFFEDYKNDKIIDFKENIDYNWEFQFIDYSQINFSKISPFIEKYFTPKIKILNLKKYFKNKYNIDPTNCIGFYYRGTDKVKETYIADFKDFDSKISEILANNKNLKILLVTDTENILKYFKNKYKDNLIFINEIKVTNKNKGIHLINSPKENYNEMFNLFASFLILSECNYLIFGSGNCSIWMTFYRGNTKNVYQYLNNNWFIN